MQVLVIGAFSSGKTTILRLLSGKSHSEETIPTLGLRMERQTIEEYKVTFLDIGGKTELIPNWPLFFGRVHGIIYAVETTNMKHAEANAQHLAEILQHPDVDGKPFLIVGTKSNSSKAMREDLLMSTYDVDNLLEQHRNAQFCFAEDKPHWVRGTNPSLSSGESVIIAAKRNISSNMIANEMTFNAQETNANAKKRSTNQPAASLNIGVSGRQPSVNKNKYYGGNQHKGVKIVSDKNSAEPLNFRSQYIDPQEEPTIVIEFMGLKQGILWLLEFIDGSKNYLNQRIRKGNQEREVGAMQRKLMKIQRCWERQCAKNIQEFVQPGGGGGGNEENPLTGGHSHIGLASTPQSRTLLQSISKLDQSAGLVNRKS